MSRAFGERRPAPSVQRAEARPITAPPADARGLGRSEPYNVRHSYATWSVGAGVAPYDVARYMGTSVRMLSRIPSHPWFGGAARARLDAFAIEATEATDDLPWGG